MCFPPCLSLCPKREREKTPQEIETDYLLRDPAKERKSSSILQEYENLSLKTINSQKLIFFFTSAIKKQQ